MLFQPKIGPIGARKGLFRPALKPEGGNTIIQVIIILTILVIAIYFVSERINRHKNIVLQTSSVLHVRFALHSVMDYAFYAIQHRYCFDDTLLPASSCELGTGVVGTKGRSVERILMSSVQARWIHDMIMTNAIDLGMEAPFKPAPAGGYSDPESVRTVDTIDVVMPAKNLNASHPLYLILEPLYRSLKAELKGVELHVRLKISRNGSATMPASGGGVHFEVKIAFEDGSGKVLTIKTNPLQPTQSGTPLEVISYGTMFPREVGTFALMVARDLHLGAASVLAPGDVSIPYFTGNIYTGSSGLLFKSPVFVNQNLRLPRNPDGNRQDRTKVYSPVTFADRVILGNGKVYEGDNVYKPKTAGGADDVLWSSNKLFGGLKMGVLIDGQYDLGIQTFGKVIPSVAVDKTLMEQCIAREQIKTTTAEIMQSELYGNLQNPATPLGGTHVFRFGLTRGNSFNPQNNPLSSFARGDWDNSGSGRDINGPPPKPTNGAVLYVKVHVSGNAYSPASAQMPKNATLTLKSERIPNSVINALENTRDALSSTQPPAAHPNRAAWDALNDKIIRYTAARANPGKLILTTKPVFLSSTPAEAQTSLVDVEVTLENPTNFMAPVSADTYKSVAPQIEFLAYDPLYQNSVLVSAGSSNPKMTRFLNYTIDNTNPLAPVVDNPAHFSTTQGGAEIPDADAPYATASPSYDATDWVDFENRCAAARGAATGQSFGAASWNRDYSPSTAASWNFAFGDTNVTLTTLVNIDTTLGLEKRFNGMNSKNVADPATTTAGVPANRDAFKPYSIVEECIIEPSAELVAGFFMCHRLIIQKRNLPLVIIGTFIVRDIVFAAAGSSFPAGNPTDARNDFMATMSAGITWMSAYHSEAVPILRAARILRPYAPPEGDCVDGVTSMPIWATSASSLQQQQNNLKCNVVSLRGTAQPFQWTSVDPDCGVNEVGSANTKCKHHPVNFLVMEHGRGGGP